MKVELGGTSSNFPHKTQTERTVMINLIEEAIMLEISKFNTEFSTQHTLGAISTYSMSRMASGVWQIVIFWKGKIVKGQKSRLHIELDAESETTKIAIDAMERLLIKAKGIPLREKLEAKNRKVKALNAPTPSGF